MDIYIIGHKCFYRAMGYAYSVSVEHSGSLSALKTKREGFTDHDGTRKTNMEYK